MIVVDTDILSMFAKADMIDLLKSVLSARAVMTPIIRMEISVPLEFGYEFPYRVISSIRTVQLTEQALEEFGRLQENLNLGKGELEAIAYCKKENALLATNDIKARKVAKIEGVSVISLQAILKAIWKKGIRNKKEVKELINKLREVDNLELNREVERKIFKE